MSVRSGFRSSSSSGSSSRSRVRARVRVREKLPPRSPLQWALAAVGSVAFWTLLLTDALAPRTAVGLLFAGGWTLSLLPVHSSLKARIPRRRSLPQAPPLDPEPELIPPSEP